MTKGVRGSILTFLLLSVLTIGALGGLVYWTLPLLGLEQEEQSQPDQQEAPLVPRDPSTVKAKVLDEPAKAADRQEKEPEPISAIVSRVGATVVKITTVQEQVTYDMFWGQTRDQVEGEGSGVIFDERGYILTNNHVVAGADEIIVVVNDKEGKGREVKGQVLGRDAVTDLAVVKINAEGLPVARLGNSDRIEAGNTAIAIGNPLGFANTVTVGVISALNRDLPIEEGTELVDLIQTDAAINPGNSGGALFNLDGEVVGINTAIIQGAQGIGFAIPINTAREIATQLIEKGRVIRPWLGIYGTTITPEVRGELKLRETYGVYIDQALPNSPAAEGGIRERDVIQGIGNVKVESMEDLLLELRKQKVGGKIKLTVSRDGRVSHPTITLKARPAELDE